MNFLVFVYITFFALLYLECSMTELLDFKDIVYTIISQENLRHKQQALKLKNEINRQTNFSSVVYITNIDLKHAGDWTILPVLPMIWEKHKQKFTWLFFCTDETVIDVALLKKLLESFNSSVTFAGRGLEDKDPTIIHHFFTPTGFKYPLFSSGFVLHYNLVKKLTKKLNGLENIKMDFSIDASHELATFIKTNGEGTLFTHSPLFCVNYKKNCVTYTQNDLQCDEQPVDIATIYFAVKTYHKFHQDRVPVVLKTWAPRCYHITFYSDVQDEKIPTVDLGIPNTDHGHCGKTEAIILNIKKKMDSNKNLEWAVITDDDTLISAYRLQKLLGCYRSSDTIAIGERYGFKVFFDYGYNYLTGGGGVVLSKKAVTKFSEGDCKCPSHSTPDDMFLFGICLLQLNITIVHIPMFHQARPNDYSDEYLMVQPPISFHKHWMIDPIQVYNKWFLSSDILIKKTKIRSDL